MRSARVLLLSAVVLLATCKAKLGGVKANPCRGKKGIALKRCTANSEKTQAPVEETPAPPAESGEANGTNDEVNSVNSQKAKKLREQAKKQKQNCEVWIDGCKNSYYNGGSKWNGPPAVKTCSNKDQKPTYCKKCADDYIVKNQMCAKKKQTLPDSGYRANCSSYFDGCNTCRAGGACTKGRRMMACKRPYKEKPYCKKCNVGYLLVKGQCNKDKADNSYHKNCVSWYDGCNNVTNDGKNTLMACKKNGDQYCTKCAEGYALTGRKGQERCAKKTVTEDDSYQKNCVTWNDGCNTGGKNGRATKKFCKRKGSPYCTSCETGYALTGGKGKKRCTKKPDKVDK